MSNRRTITLPDSIKEIGDYAFKWQNVNKLPLSLEKLGKEAFWDASFENPIVIPPAIETVAKNTFALAKTSKIVISDGVKVIEDSAFQGSKAAELELGNTVEKIGASAFKDNNLQSFVLPESLKEIGDSAFANNTALTTVKIPDTVEKIGRNVFSGARNLQIDISESSPIYQEVSMEYSSYLLPSWLF